MKIASVRIRNFRTLKDVAIPFDSVTTFIGPNGTGKSTVLRALDWFFNGKPGCLSDRDCSFGATDESIEVQVTFDNLTTGDRQALGKYAPGSATTFTAWKQRRPDGSEVLSANAKGLPAFQAIKLASTATLKKELYASLRNDQPKLKLPAANTGTLVEQEMVAWEAANVEQLQDSPDILQTNFFGFNSGGKMSGLFDYVLVTADLRASEEAIDGRGSIVGRILERSIDRTSADEAIAKIVADARVLQQQVYEDKFKEQIEGITSRLNEVVTTYAPGRAIKVSPAETELKPPRTTFDVSVMDGVNQTAVERQGHGFQRTLLISALQLLAQSGAASAEGIICLAIEEPELFQHPIQAQTFAKVLRSLAEDPQKRIQVTYATHSPYFLESRHFNQVRRMTRSADAVPVVTIHFATVEDVKIALDGIVDPEVVDRRLDHNVADQLSIALFANRAFLVEGATESAVFYGIRDRVVAGALEAAGVSIVAVGSKTSIPLAHAILKSIGVPVYALFDADGGYELRCKATGKDQAKIEQERHNHARENRQLMRYFGQPEVDFPETSVTGVVAILGDRLEEFLEAEWGEWMDACKQVEADMGIDLTKNQLAYRTATLRATGKVPDLLNTILLLAEGK